MQVTFINNQACSGLFQIDIGLHDNQLVSEALTRLAGLVEHAKEKKSSEIVTMVTSEWLRDSR